MQNSEPKAAEAAQRWDETPNHPFVTDAHPHFSRALADIDAAPLWLYASFDVDLLVRPSIAIASNRNPIAGGRELAHGFARRLAGARLVIFSGCPRGIDAAAHEGVLATGGMTVAAAARGSTRSIPRCQRRSGPTHRRQ